jgi:hypothetical protein
VSAGTVGLISMFYSWSLALCLFCCLDRMNETCFRDFLREIQDWRYKRDPTLINGAVKHNIQLLLGTEDTEVIRPFCGPSRLRAATEVAPLQALSANSLCVVEKSDERAAAKLQRESLVMRLLAERKELLLKSQTSSNTSKMKQVLMQDPLICFQVAFYLWLMEY